MTSLKHNSAANDDVTGAGRDLGAPGELLWDFLRRRVRPVSGSMGGVEGFMPRPKLEAALARALRPQTVLHLEAPSGYGKSTALAAGVRSHDALGSHCLVITLSERENDPSRLLSLLHLALSDPETPLDLPSPEQGCHTDRLGLLLARSPWQELSHAGVLILDDVDAITSPASCELIQHLAEELPAAMALGMCSRGPVAFETHRLELQGRYTRVGPETLALTRDETRHFFSEQLQQSRVTSIAVENVYAMSQGWLTPLALYRRDIAETATPRMKLQETASVQRFIRDTVLAHLSPGQLTSLRVMSEMDEVSDEFYLALDPDGETSGLLPSRASDLGLPLFPLIGLGRWYRFNPLVQCWLANPPLAGRSRRHAAASRWFRERSRYAEALRYALLSGDVDEVLAITSRDSEALLLGQDTASLLKLRRKLPPGLIEQSHRLSVVYGWVHAIGGQYQQAEALIDGLEPGRRDSGRVLALRAFILRGRGAVRPAIELAEQSLAGGQLSTQGKLISQLVRSSALCAAGRFADAREANRSAAKLAREAGDSGSEALAVYGHARIELGKGALHHARQLLQTGLDTALNESTGPARVGATRLQLNLALILWHQGQVEQADQMLTDCIRETEQNRDLGLLLALVLQGVLARDQRRLEDAFAWVGNAERIMQAWKVDSSVYLPVLEALKASCWLVNGQTDSAMQALERLKPFRERQFSPELFPMLQRLTDFLEVRIYIARREFSEARRRLAVLQAHEGGRNNALAMALHLQLLEVVLLWHERGGIRAQVMLSEAIKLAAGEHFVSPFADMLDELAEPMAKILPTLPATEFVRELARLYGISLSGASRPQLAEPISDREYGVLELIAQGLSNQGIADRLHISLHTVKTHARRINAKLEVRSRTQAIVRARELGILND